MSEALRPVVIPDVPTRALLAFDDHLSELVREFKLIAIGDADGGGNHTPARLHALIDEVLADFADTRHEARRQAELAAATGQEKVTIHLWLPPEGASAAVRFLELLEEADRFCRDETLLSLAAPPEVVELRQWYVREVVRQLLAPA